MKTFSTTLLLIFSTIIGASAQQQAPTNPQMVIHKVPFAPDSLKSINRVFLSLYMGAGEGSANFTGLHQFEQYQQLPYNIAPQYLFEITVGKPNVLYASWFIKGSIVSTNSSGAQTFCIDGYTGINVGHMLYDNPHRKFLSSISPEIGIAYGGVDIRTGDAQGQTVANTILLNGDVSFDLLKWYTKMQYLDSPQGRATSVGCSAITLKLGYAYQIGNSWCCPHVNPHASVDMSGFYASLGFTITTRNRWQPK